jgi:hypothetical protein
VREDAVVAAGRKTVMASTRRPSSPTPMPVNTFVASGDKPGPARLLRCLDALIIDGKQVSVCLDLALVFDRWMDG